jgi:NADH-quinone oxidoreductase subunit N
MGFRAPVASVAMVVFLVSLTGLPPTVGFYGKYLLFVEGWAAGLGWLVLLMALMSVVSLFYYFRVAKALFLATESDRPVTRQPVLLATLAALAVFTFACGLWAQPLEVLARSSLDILRAAL